MYKILLLTLLIFSLNAYSAQPSPITVNIKGDQAKNIYNLLIGHHVNAEGAAGHSYKTGKNILCVYVTADMDDEKHQAIPQGDVRRYTCKFKVDLNGAVFATVY